MSRKDAIEILKLSGIEYLISSGPGKSLEDSVPVGEISEKEDDLIHLRNEIGDCRKCRLHEGRTNLVFGVGNPKARLMFVGEGPGADEDAKGEPFVGAAGKRLNVWISYLGLEREDVYIANIVKCRPPNNRTPYVDEALACVPFLRKQIEIISPELLVTLGGPALNYLLERNEKITRVRGRMFDYRGIPVIPTYHPAFILRNPAREREVYLDLDKIRDFLGIRK